MRAKLPEELDEVPDWAEVNTRSKVTHCLKIGPSTIILHGEYTQDDPPTNELRGEKCWMEIQRLLPSGAVAWLHPNNMSDGEQELYHMINYMFSRLVHGDEYPDITFLYRDTT